MVLEDVAVIGVPIELFGCLDPIRRRGLRLERRGYSLLPWPK
jgi:hypothetical protein